MDRSKDWLVALTGVAFIVVVVASFVIMGGDPPDAESSAQEIADHYVDNKSKVQIGAFVGTCAGALLIFFFGYLRKALREAGAGSTLSALPLIGATIVAIGAAIDGTISFALAEAADDIEPESVRTLQALWDSDFMPFALGFQVLWLSAGIAIVRHGAVPKWLGWIAILLGVLAFTPIGFVGFFGGAAWILIVSILLSLRARRGPQAPAPAV